MQEGLATGPVHILLEVPPAILTPARVKVKGVKVTSSGRKAEGLELGRLPSW